MRPDPEDLLERLPEPLRRECEEWERAGRRRARWDLVLGVIAVIAFIAGWGAVLAILMS